jgi:beta-glucosidase
MAPDAIRTADYTEPFQPAPEDPRVKAFLDTLTDKEMVDIVVGIGQVGGKRRFVLPGSVGNTTGKFWDRGLANVALCDGPAGLRVSRHSTVGKRGNIRLVEVTLSVYSVIPGFVRKLLMGNPEKEPSLYQHATAFPVTNALAQSWNKALLEKVGAAIAREMAEFGCTYWLAPAVNIHRNPLCGRNFEYFSEDPRLTGDLAAAMTRGVQGQPGYYATVKHFACNNQEDNRNFMSSNVSQRALREIYLRGFEATVGHGGAKAVMTPYNKLNGVYTPNSRDLCTVVLRQEWGFDGVVMTDWYSTNPRQGDDALAIAAGNDLIMPGGGYFKRQILRGLRKGKVTRQQLRCCCGRVVRAIFDSPIQQEYIG